MSIQPQLTPKMRSILIDWLIELSEHFSFGPSTLHLAVTLVDRVLASEHDTDEDDGTKDTRCYVIPRDRFQLLGATCVWMACKVQEKSAPKASEIAYVSDHIYSTEQIKRMERRICNALNFDLFGAPTPHQFLFEFLRASLVGCPGIGEASSSVFRDMAHYLLELGRMPYAPTLRNPSLLAAAAVYLARLTLGVPRTLEAIHAAQSNTAGGAASGAAGGKPGRNHNNQNNNHNNHTRYYWTPTLEHYTGYKAEELRETVLELHKYHMAAETSGLKATFNKYKLKKYHRVALKTVLPVGELGFP
eukprot:jgi/Psemu1/177866/e_gw1.2.282.1